MLLQTIVAKKAWTRGDQNWREKVWVLGHLLKSNKTEYPYIPQLMANTILILKWTNGSLSFSETVYLASLYNTDQGSRINQLLKKIWMSKNCWGSSEENIWHRQTRVSKSTFRQMDQSCMSKDTWLEKGMNLAYGIWLINGLHTRVNGRMIRDLCFIW